MKTSDFCAILSFMCFVFTIVGGDYGIIVLIMSLNSMWICQTIEVKV